MLWDRNVEAGINAIIVRFKCVCNSIFFVDVVVRLNNNPVNDMTALTSGLIKVLNIMQMLNVDFVEYQQQLFSIDFS